MRMDLELNFKGELGLINNAYAQSFSCVQLSVSPWTVLIRLLCQGDSPGKNTEVGCHFLLKEILLTQGSNPHSSLESPALTGSFFTTDSPVF